MRRLLLPLLVLLAGLLAAPRAEANAPALRGAAEAALGCARDAVMPQMADCLAAVATSPELRQGLACALRGKEVLDCLGIEIGLIGACVIAGGGSMEAAAGCVALRMAGQEAAKCFAVGVGVPGGCFGPGHELRRWARAVGAIELPSWRAVAATLLPGS